MVKVSSGGRRGEGMSGGNELGSRWVGGLNGVIGG